MQEFSVTLSADSTFPATDPNSESRLPLISLDIYVPRDERFGHLKMADFLTYALKALVQAVVPVLEAIADETPNEFDSFEDILKLYEGGLPVAKVPLLDELRDRIPFEMIRELFRTEGNQRLLKLPIPQIIEGTLISSPKELSGSFRSITFKRAILCFCSQQVRLENGRGVCSGDAGWRQPCDH